MDGLLRVELWIDSRLSFQGEVFVGFWESVVGGEILGGCGDSAVLRAFL